MKKIITVTDVETIVCDHFEVDKSLLRTKTRKAPVPLCRHLIYWFSRTIVRPFPSLIHISERYGQDHTTAINGIEVIANRIKYEDGFKELVIELENKIST